MKDDTQVTAEGWRELVGEYKAYFKEKTGKDFPEDPDGAALGRDWRGVRVMDGREGRHLPARRENHRTAGHGSERGADGVRQYRARIPARAFASRAILRRARRFSLAISC